MVQTATLSVTPRHLKKIKGPLNADELRKMHAYWRAAN
jgi:hypothetical protein